MPTVKPRAAAISNRATVNSNGSGNTLVNSNDGGNNIVNSNGGGDTTVISNGDGNDTIVNSNGGGDTTAISSGDGSDTIVNSNGGGDTTAISSGDGNDTIVNSNGDGDTTSISNGDGHDTTVTSNGDSKGGDGTVESNGGTSGQNPGSSSLNPSKGNVSSTSVFSPSTGTAIPSSSTTTDQPSSSTTAIKSGTGEPLKAAPTKNDNKLRIILPACIVVSLAIILGLAGLCCWRVRRRRQLHQQSEWSTRPTSFPLEMEPTRQVTGRGIKGYHMRLPSDSLYPIQENMPRSTKSRGQINTTSPTPDLAGGVHRRGSSTTMQFEPREVQRERHLLLSVVHRVDALETAIRTPVANLQSPAGFMEVEDRPPDYATSSRQT
ncbi:hypothetical protein NP233_g4240 [Leucocoprinus birnbaumii]|uniref:Uncharacterized protein n=1 Tax=Leucocoprinus birnbaumii TaxID=56174 RepID=A0AAD5VV17_9AGAR|nr:hypothetical protein NP233_g4240 [Leucocoprinus birnbaumii]